jgi:hypothetical protein
MKYVARVQCTGLIDVLIEASSAREAEDIVNENDFYVDCNSLTDHGCGGGADALIVWVKTQDECEEWERKQYELELESLAYFKSKFRIQSTDTITDNSSDSR